MLIASGFSWFHLIPGVEDGSLIPPMGEFSFVFISAWFACFMLVAMAFSARKGLMTATARGGLEQYYADESMSARTVGEMFYGAIHGLMSDAMGRDDVKRFFPLVGGLAAYIFVCNLMALVPGFQPPTDNINTNVGMAVMVFVTFMGVGLLRDPVGFVKHMMGPVPALAILMFPIELVGLAVRPISLSIRLTGNMFGDHTVFGIMSDLVPPLVPVAFLALATLVSAIQAGVFALLTVIYISLSLPHGDDDDHH